jgi:hypothetical protein
MQALAGSAVRLACKRLLNRSLGISLGRREWVGVRLVPGTLAFWEARDVTKGIPPAPALGHSSLPVTDPESVEPTRTTEARHETTYCAGHNCRRACGATGATAAPSAIDQRQKLCLRQSGTFDSDAAIYYVCVSSSFFTLQQLDQARRLCERSGGTFSGSASNYRCNGAS